MDAADAGLSIPPRAVIALLRAYKVLFSVQFAGSCRYWPSCSEYASEAVRRFGVVAGSWLAMRRLSRCHPLGASGYDPVPVSPCSSSTHVPDSPSQAPPQI